MLGYYKDEQSTAKTIRGDLLYTGDNAYADEQGYLYFFDRKKDMIKRAGENVSAIEVESVLAEHPQVDEAAIVGVPDPIRDEAVAAVIVPVDGAELSDEEIFEYCARAALAVQGADDRRVRDGVAEDVDRQGAEGRAAETVGGGGGRLDSWHGDRRSLAVAGDRWPRTPSAARSGHRHSPRPVRPPFLADRDGAPGSQVREHRASSVSFNKGVASSPPQP